MNTRADVAALPRSVLLQLSVVTVITLAPYFFFQPVSISVLCAVLILWRGWLAWRDAPRPARWVLLPIAMAGLALTFAAFGNLLGKQPGLALLALFLPLKLLETHRQRDARAAMLLACFLLIGQFLNEQTPWIALCTVCGAIGVIASLVRLQRPNCAPLPALRVALGLIGQGAPMMLALFVLFPRIDGPLWGLPLDAYGGKTGLAESMSPGSISSLVESEDIAFRAAFNGSPPPRAELYWRGPVFTNFNGREWAADSSSVQDDATYTPSGQAYDYTLTLEPNNQRWLLALDFPEPTSAGHIKSDFVLVANRPVRTRIRYALRSYPATPVGVDEDSLMIAAALQLPPGYNPRTLALGRRIKQENASPDMRVKSAIDFMRQAGLQYTLYPPLLGEHTVDEFLFDSRRGFCEHFSAAFVVLMRAAEVPARVVTGYQGGEVNPIDGTLVVRQSDAHAWAEVWLAGRGWVRVDPTAASFPSRIDIGLAGALPSNETLPLSLRAEDIEVLRNLRYRWEALSNTWNQWVLGYNAHRQLDLMHSIGFRHAGWRTLTILMTSACCAWMLWLAWRAWPRQQRRDALDRCWQQLCRKLARKGLPRQKWEAPTDYANRIAALRPALGKAVQHIAERYSVLRFGSKTVTIQDVAALKLAIKQFET
ncbi:MAG TPA: DUF3488 and transglutaminase-like domain-containing protein [Rhodocyclaceae bacterium]|nr:DUF3488 and transglutaminase-like domain-containing protein [Rhodocyclaceae bacterium]